MYDEVDKLKEEERELAAADGRLSTDGEASMRRRHGGGGLFVGLALIGLGVIFLLQSAFGLEPIRNWWALFIFIPAVSNLSCGWNAYRSSGSLAEGMENGLTTGILLSAVALIFLLGLGFGRWWPALLILLGLSLLLKGRG